MGQDSIINTCEYDLEIDMKSLERYDCEIVNSQNEFIAHELRRIGDKCNEKYEFGNLVCGILRNFGIQHFTDLLVTGVQGILMLKIALS